MNRLKSFIILLALASTMLTSAFSSISVQKGEGNCSIFLLLSTLLTNNAPCGFNRTEIVSFIAEYVNEIVEEIAQLPQPTLMPNRTILIPQITNTPIPTSARATNTLTMKQAVHTKSSNRNTATLVEFTPTRVIFTRTAAVPSATNTLVPTFTSVPTNTNTLEPTSTPVPTDTQEPPTPTEEVVIEETETPQE